MIRAVALIAALATATPCGQGVTCPQLPDRDDSFSDELTAEIDQFQVPGGSALVIAAKEDIQLRGYFEKVCSGT